LASQRDTTVPIESLSGARQHAHTQALEEKIISSFVGGTYGAAPTNTSSKNHTNNVGKNL